jgi:hypothetical protein
MLDVSMIAHPTPLRKLMALAAAAPYELAGLRVSATFIDRISNRQDYRDDLVRQISRTFSVSAGSIDLKLMREFIESPPFEEFVRPFRTESATRTEAYRQLLLKEVPEDDAWAYEIVAEEWEFLTTHSWLFAKTRAIYDRMINAGANALYVTKEKLEQAIDAAGEGVHSFGHEMLRGSDRVVRRTLKKGPHHNVSPNDRVRTLAKWVAVGGSAATALINPAVGAVGGTVGGLFLLYDP